MKRREEIRQEAHRKYPYVGGIKGMICENSIPIFIQGAKWADKTMIEKACDWMKLRLVARIGSEDAHEFLTEFRKAMEE